MNSFTSRFEEIWKTSEPLALVLVISGMSLAMWTTYHPQSPGFSIGMLALVAGIMSVRPDMKIYEKMCWIAILIAFAVLEVRAINKTDDDNKATRTEQNRKFEEIAGRINQSIKSSKEQFDSTVGHVDSVLKSTQEVAKTAKSNLENVTGGDSFAYIVPQTVDYRFGPYAMSIQNGGSQILSGVSVRISKITSGCPNLSPTASPCQLTMDNGLMNPISMGTLSPHVAVEMPGMITADENGEGRYFIQISAQNGLSNEMIWFRTSKNGHGSAYRFIVSRELANKKQGKVMERDWTEPTK